MNLFRYKLLNQLLTISVSDNTLKLEPVLLKTSFKTGSEDQKLFQLAYNCPELSLTVPSHSWARNLNGTKLCSIRNICVTLHY